MIDTVRARIIELEGAATFDQSAWNRVLETLNAQGRIAGYEDAKRRMYRARQYSRN